ncbi:MAG TPA: hypothetical protein V6D33_12660 [Cyanophyceae cyanobacterium]
MNNPIKATRAKIELGDIPLEVFMLPSGSYRLSELQATEAVDKTNGYIRDFLKGKSPEALPWKGYTAEKIEIEKDHDGRGSSRISAVPIELAVAFWTKEAIAGNTRAARLLGACATESIERRADAAFGVQQSEHERQTKMKARIDGKVIRRQLTDAIADYLKKHPELSNNDKRWIYKNCSDRTNKLAIGKVAKKAAEDLRCDQSKLRDFLETNELVKLTSLEDLTVRIIDLHDIHPLDAVKQAAERLLF